jgi:hypothetical protein
LSPRDSPPSVSPGKRFSLKKRRFGWSSLGSSNRAFEPVRGFLFPIDRAVQSLVAGRAQVHRAPPKVRSASAVHVQPGVLVPRVGLGEPLHHPLSPLPVVRAGAHGLLPCCVCVCTVSYVAGRRPGGEAHAPTLRPLTHHDAFRGLRTPPTSYDAHS